MSSVETGQMSAVETGQMYAAATGQMSAVETRQMYSIKTGQRPVAIVDICLVSTADICPVSAADICPVSAADICPVATEDIYLVFTEDIKSWPSEAATAADLINDHKYMACGGRDSGRQKSLHGAMDDSSLSTKQNRHRHMLESDLRHNNTLVRRPVKPDRKQSRCFHPEWLIDITPCAGGVLRVTSRPALRKHAARSLSQA